MVSSGLGRAGQGRAEAMALTGNLSVGRGERIDSSAQAEFRPERSEPNMRGSVTPFQRSDSHQLAGGLEILIPLVLGSVVIC